MNEIWSIILAAGESRRMGTPKLLLPFGTGTIIEKVIENVTASDVGNSLVVLGPARDIIIERIKYLPVSHCYNENYREGMLSSVWCGLSNLPAKYEAVVVMPGDYPGIRTEIINMLINSFRRSGKKIVVPLFRGTRGHPILISYDCRDQVMNLKPEEGLRGLAVRFPRDVMEVPVNDPAILRDIDTLDDYLSEIKQIT